MALTIADLHKGDTAIITDVSSKQIPLKLLEMGCLPGNEVELLQVAPFKDPMYLNINGSYLAIRKETAALITIELIDAKTD
ncbi:FeoA domain-containing protein [Winogradskyella sp. 3972H.M.0a.05]|uniref:FeoA family protein n=1 Tax=Winogradskyella sp. 3972H.M.0a.05 TaxID=2950277 RepID=UPI00339B1147